MNDNDYNSIETRVLEKTEQYRTVVGLKHSQEGFFIDTRKWYKAARMDSSKFGPSKRGICLSLEDWQAVIPMIQELIAKSNFSNGSDKS